MPGDRRVVGTDRHPDHDQNRLNFLGGVHRRPALLGQHGIRADAERVDQLRVTRSGFLLDDTETYFRVGDNLNHASEMHAKS